MKLGHLRPASGKATHGIDRMVQNIETGHFELPIASAAIVASILRREK